MFGINFFEFCKVFSIVFGISFMIFSIKKVVVDLSDEDTDSKKQEQDDQAKVIPIRTSPDFIDYDGMGNQGRFPKRKKS
tara:strand:- start:869 stop:1105 length:237 start_codon:yes stop_codon:yes gene_type:complete